MIPDVRKPVHLCIPKVHAKTEPPRTSGARLVLACAGVELVEVSEESEAVTDAGVSVPGCMPGGLGGRVRDRGIGVLRWI